MNRLSFGQLVASLRQDLGWTQAQLAEYANMDNATLSNIERGAKRHLDPEILLQLANVLQLTSLERREFFLGACGIQQDKLVRQPLPSAHLPTFDAAALVNLLTTQMEQVQLPANLGDCYGDILAVNRLQLEIFQMQPETLKYLAHEMGGFSNLDFVYGMIQSQEALGDEFSKSALEAIRAFREGSLRYRATPYYQRIMKKFRDPNRYPLFERYWRRTSSLDEDKESTFSTLQIQHDEYNTLSLSVTSSNVMTPYGELFLSYFMPMDAHTSASLISMNAALGNQVLHISSWPEKKLLV